MTTVAPEVSKEECPPLLPPARLFQVVIPILANEKNHLDWPHVVCQDVQRHAHSLQGDLLVLLEQLKGKTLLPLPVGAEQLELVASQSETGLDCDKSIIYALESAVIQWSRRVQLVLKRESSQSLQQGESPTPKAELEFWKSRSEDLDYIYNQLRAIKMRGTARLLDKLQSSYFPAFQAMFRDVRAALTEARDIRTHLMPLSRHLEVLESLEFPEVKPRLRPLLHVVCLIWATCESYRSPGRLTILLQEICNLLIQQASNYLCPEGLLRSEVEESQRKLHVAVDTLSFFKQGFQDRREHLRAYFKENQEVRQWDFQSSLVFERLDGFLGRLLMVQDLLKTALDFHHLGKLEFSGIRGNALSQQVQQMYDGFQEMYRVFSESSYDCLDPQSMEFENDVCEFNRRVEDLDRRLGAIFSQAFDDAPDLEHAFKLLDIAGKLLERPLVAQDASEKYLLLIQMFIKDLDTVRAIYSQRVQEEAELGFSSVHKNMPTVAGGLRWAQELRQRIQGPFANFKRITHPCMDSAEGKRMTQKYEDTLSLLEKYETRLYEDWCQTVSEKSQYNLSRPLLKRDSETKQIAVNFNPQLLSVLKEMSYLEPRQMQHIPETATAMFSSREFYRQLVAKLELMANWYNKVVKTLAEVEFPLVEEELRGIDLRLRAAEGTLNWKTEGIWDYVIQITNSIHDLEQRIQKAKDNVEEIQNIMKTWVSPIFKRKDGKKECLLSMDDQHDRMEKYYHLIRESGLKIHALVQENLGLFAADPTSNIWKTYVNYIDEMLLDGFFLAIECSLKYLLENTECKAGLTPIFEVQLSLAIPELVFSPPLEYGVKGGFYDAVEGLVTSIFGISSLVPRLSPQNSSPHYQVDVEGMAPLASMRSTLLDRVQSMMALCCGYRSAFSQYSYLYVEDRREILSQFLLYGRVLTPEEKEAHIEDGIPENHPPLLHQFKAQIDSYERLYEEVCRLEPIKVFDGWMKIDLRPLKASLLNLIKRWSLTFKQHLVDYVTNRSATDSKRFEGIDIDFKELAYAAQKTPNVVEATNKPGLYEKLEDLQSRLYLCEKALAEYLDTKRLAFPRFYFLSSSDLLDALSNGTAPQQVQRHLSKLFDNMAKMQFQPDAGEPPTKISLGMYSKEGEYVAFSEPCDCSGRVEIWLNRVLAHMRATVRHGMTEGVVAYEEKPREQWLFDYPAQVALTCTQIWWTTEVGIAFARLEEGYENAMKDYYKKQVAQLKTLITMLIGHLSKGDRQKIMTICTIDVHARDVVAKMIAQKVDSAQAFLWLSQLRHRWDDEAKHCFANICDAQFLYSYEYLGNTPRLVITPLTDRCYITLTQSLHLTMSGAPAGPAGTGKTETTKDLGRALGIMVYVFNCSEQMDYKSCGNIYKGLAQTGAWGCFDEFNRISVEVLSVVAVQVKSIQDAIRDKKQWFNFLGEEISLDPSVGIFITMNPGYAGRTELPENLKALFRPCAMVVPDFELICEIMLVAEGFIEARSLARKFITLYQLCKELLSKQDHYDWGLRAIKSVLVVAGSLKRGDPDRPEDQVLMRSLRDFNIPKIVTDDIPVFMGLIGDLFPALDVPRRRDLNFEALVRKAVVDLKLQAEDNFVLKVVQLEELLAVRHSVFVVGSAGTGKSQVLKSLHKTYQIMKRRPVWADLNPKAVTNDELFGIINPATREWKDGLFSSIMRELANLTHDGPKWILLDGDIDPMWIESLNTVMDDNKVLTLASNERIPLNPTMRLLFEISHLRTATPATVSRAGILYINPADLGWNPPVSSWIDKREMQTERANLTILFDKYLPTCLDTLRTRFKKIIPIPEQSMVQMLCHLLECLLAEEDIPADCPKETYELYFVFAAIWAFGGAMVQDQLVDYRAEFSKWWLTEFKTIKFPSQGTIFDYYIDPATKKFEPWSKLIPQFEFDPEIPLQACLVHASETIRVCYFLERLMERRRPVMLVGTAGTGKSVLVGTKLASLDPEEYLVRNVLFNYYTTSAMLQAVLEKPLEKKAGRNYGPPGNKKLIYFIDDMNMPEVDAYGTVQPHTIIRQHLDYGHWYDQSKLSLKEIRNVQYVSCMNPTAGSFTINPRLQRHFSVFVLSFPGADALASIYGTILTQHLTFGHFPAALQKSSPQLINLALTFHQKIATTFLPTAIKFHYVFNLRDFANIFQGILFSSVECVKSTQDLVKLYLHESNRVYRDKMVEEKDFDLFDKIQTEVVKKIFDDIDETVEQTRSLNMYCHFASGIGEPKYMPVQSWELLTQTLVEALENHNEVNTVMDLVLFEDAMRHVCHINRILESPRGNALLVGVGGSGKQSLTRLAAFISSMDVFQITLRKGYQIPDFKMDLAGLCLKAGVKNLSTVFLMTDAQVADEKFLVLINDLLASGEIPDLYSDDEVENIINNVRNEVKSQGLVDNRENCWKFFINRVRRQLKVTLCFSPVGNKLRVRSRKFPAIVNCTAIDWFHEWPRQALESVSLRFLQNTEGIEPTVKQSVSKFMAFVHTSVNQMSQSYLSNEQRYNYTTPKSFLEFIRLYQSLLRRNGEELKSKMERLENGLLKLHSTSAQVDGLKAKLAAQEGELRQKNEDADKLIQVVGIETDKVSREKAMADEEERRVALIMLEVKQKQKDCEEDLAKAEPALTAAQAALNTLNKTNLTELKSFGAPPPAVSNVSAAVMTLTAPGGRVPKDRSWKAAKVTMAKVDGFLDSLINFDKENIPESCLKAIRPYLQDPEFRPEFVATKSYAAAGLCSWVINIVRFYEVFCDVEPKRQALSRATADLTAAQENLAAIKAKIAHLNENLAKLTAKFEKATADKLKCQQEAEVTTGTISLANRLVGGLASENVRWAEAVQNFRHQESKLCGDILLATAFVSYLGFFTKSYRQNLMDGTWRPYLSRLEVPIPVTPTLDPLRMLTDDADMAAWQNQGLPADRMSMENATILLSCERWPLMVDPQLQGIKWIKNKYGENLRVTQISQKGYLQTLERALEAGDVVLIENLEESVDPVLGPLLGREVIKKGRFIKIGDKECEYNPRFRLILHTKLVNPHYQPELQAQATLINFTVTRDGLEDQLLAAVVSMERPDLEQLKSDLTKQQNGFKITLKTLEDNLLSRLSSASGNFLGDTALVENLETTKQTAAEVEKKVQEAKVMEVKINEAREHYRPAAARASLLYFIMNDLSKMHPMYQFSLKAFSIVFQKAVEKAAPDESLKERVTNLIDSITFSVYQYTTRGLFECDKLTYLAQLTFQILLMNGEVDAAELDFLLRSPGQAGVTSPVGFLSHQAWGGIKALSSMEGFYNLDRDIEGSAKSWKKFVESECPEKEKFPQEWKNKTALQRLCMMRAMRPDRMTYAMRDFVEEKLGSQYVVGRAPDFATSFEESGPATPMFFILSPGVDPLKDVENQGKKLGYTFNNRNFHNVSLGQGQEIVAEAALDLAAKKGHWVILQNIHLVAKWLGTLEEKLAEYGEHGHDTLEMCSRETEFKSILFALCYFHGVVAERRKFGPQGWNRSYPFNTGDLTISVNVLYNFLEANTKVPYDDLRYLFGEIMYGGHITDDWDRRLCRTYLEEFIRPEMLEGELSLAPGFPLPGNLDYIGYHQYIDAELPPDSPYLYGLHPNAEIGFLTQTSEKLFRTVLELQPRDSHAGDGAGATREEKVKALLEEILERVTDEFNMPELLAKVEERTPYLVVTFQECERMNVLTREIRHSLRELDLGLKGELTMTSDMETLQNALYLDTVPEPWARRAYPSTAGLGVWFLDLLNRIKELEAWLGDLAMPSTVWLTGFFNPQSFLTAIMQSTARKNEWPLDQMALQCEVTKKNREDFRSPPREGAYIHGLFMEGARWDAQAGIITEAKLKDLTPPMPVMFIKAIPADKQDCRSVYPCPVYKTCQRGPTYVWTFNLKTKEKPSKWVLAGVALLLQT
nr:dynein axonemal heavy chain 9 [Mirounga angustirostris]